MMRFSSNKKHVFAQLQTLSADLLLRLYQSISIEDLKSWTKTEKKEMLKALTMSLAIYYDKEKLETKGRGVDPDRIPDEQLEARLVALREDPEVKRYLEKKQS